MAESSIDNIKQQKNFYRALYRKEIKGLIVVFAIMATLTAGISYEATHRPPTVYYATSSDGALVPLSSLEK